MKHKLQHRFPRVCGALVGLIFLCSGSGLGLITEADAGAGNPLHKPWSPRFDNRFQRDSRGYTGGGTSTPRSTLIEQAKKSQEAKTFYVQPDGSIVIQDLFAPNKKGLDYSAFLRGGKSLSENSVKIQPGQAIQDSVRPSPALTYKESSPLEAMKRDYKEQGFARTLKEIVGSDPSPSELKAMVVDDLPDWDIK